jgi:hypothetical protein
MPQLLVAAGGAYLGGAVAGTGVFAMSATGAITGLTFGANVGWMTGSLACGPTLTKTLEACANEVLEPLLSSSGEA